MVGVRKGGCRRAVLARSRLGKILFKEFFFSVEIDEGKNVLMKNTTSDGLRSGIRGASGARSGKIRLKDVAAAAGVAVNTASTILNRRPNSWASKETEERVFKAASELGYRPNRAALGLRIGRFNAVGLLVADINNPFYTAFAHFLTLEAERQGYDVVIET